MKGKLILSGLLVCLAAAAVCFAADAFTGTWKLNEGKSKMPPGVTKNTTVTYEQVGDSVKVTLDGIGADGKPPTTSGRASTMARTIRLPAIPIMTRGRTRRSTTARSRSPERRATRLCLRPRSSFPPTARRARLRQRKPARTARKRRASRSTTGNNRASKAISPPQRRSRQPERRCDGILLFAAAAGRRSGGVS